MNIKQLRQAQADARAKAKAIHDAPAGANGRLSADQLTQFNSLIAEANGYDADITAAQAVLDMERVAPAIHSVPVRESISVGRDNRQDRPWANAGEFLQGVRTATMTRGANVDPRFYAALGQNETIDAEGGFLLSPQLSTELLTRTYQDGPIASRCSTTPMSSPMLRINGIEDSNRVGGPAGAGVAVYRIAEAALYARSLMKFRRVEFNANKMIALFYATDEIINDAPALSAQLQKYIPRAFKWKVENEVLNGTGVGEFLGINTSGAVVVTPKVAGQASGSFVAQNALDMRARFWPYSRPRGVWLTGPDLEASLFNLVLPAATGTAAALYTAPGANGNNSPYGMMLNMPVIVVEQTAIQGVQGDIMLVDLSEYEIAELLGDTDNPVFAASIHVAFLTGEQAWRWTLRNDGQPLWDKPVTQNNSANKVSPFVTLASRP